ncbi:MAG: coat protein/nuclear export [Cressdnaviricota sp.]|nr:MAG: coat protein/nuclear export [Cressdnaviricota sp.]
MPNRILATPAELGRMARKSYVKKAGRRGRAAVLQGKRTGFAAPAPSRVPVGSIETKVKRNNLLQLTPSNLGQIVTMNTNINQGTAIYNRIGHRFRNTACRIKGHFYADANGPRAAICGYAWVWDKIPYGATPGVGEIFTLDSVQPGFDMSNTMLVDDNSDRFTVLKSTRRVIGKLMSTGGTPATTMNNCPNIVLVDDLIKLPAWCVSGFKKGQIPGTTANHLSGALYLVPFVSNTSGETANTVKFDFTSELFFAEA